MVCYIRYVTYRLIWLDSAALLVKKVTQFLWQNLDTDIKRSSVGEDAPGVPLLWNDYDDGIGNFNIHFKLGTNSISPNSDSVADITDVCDITLMGFVEFK